MNRFDPRPGPRLRRWTAVTGLAAALLLSGCAGTAPGVAAQVGEDRITLDDVDEFAQVLCALDSSAQQSSPTRAARFGALEILLSNQLAFDLAEDVEVDQSAVNQALDSLRSSRDVVPPELVGTFDEVAEEFARAQASVLAVGREAVVESGESRPTDQVAFSAGERLRQEYAEAADIEVDPRFGEFVDGRLVPTEGALSVPVSELAVQLTAEEPTTDLTELLPATLVCG